MIADNLALQPNLTSTHTKEIAVIGLGCRFPGGVNNPADYWQLLQAGRCAISQQTRFKLEDDNSPGQRGGFLDQVDQFDAPFFQISPKEAIALDPQQRLLMEVSWEALEHAGLNPESLRGTDTGVFVGIFSNDYQLLQVKQNDVPHLYRSTGTSAATASGRLSYFFGFQGPAISVDTASSSSLVAFHLACQSLLNQECHVVLACGINLILAPDISIAFARAGMLSPEGLSKGFDASADGYVRGEGCGVVILKLLAEAERDGDNILAVVRGTAINQDGASQGLTAPSEASQVQVIRKALTAANMQPADVSYIEAHGSGTPVGDPIEGNALQAVYGAGRPTPWMIGSVKSNIGHLEAAAGISGVIKTVLALQHGYIPAHLHFKQLNPNLKSLQAIIPTTGQPWERYNDQPRRAGVSSFGLSGTNAHIILEEAPPYLSSPTEPARNQPYHLIPLSAKSEPALRQLAQRYLAYLTTNPNVALADISYTASVGRAHFEHRLATIAASPAELQEQLQSFIDDEATPGLVSGTVNQHEKPKVAFLFTGQGSQYVGMGQQLYETQPTFRQAIDRCGEILGPVLKQPLRDILYLADETKMIHQTNYTQPVLFSIGYALAQVWLSWGIKPDYVLGHSVGEYAAACMAGVFSLEDGLKLIAERGRLMQATKPGKMVALKANLKTVQEAIHSYTRSYGNQVSIAVINGPENVVIAGEPEALDEVIEALPQVQLTDLAVSRAFHSPLMDPILDEFEQVAQNVSFSQPKLNFISNVTGNLTNQEITSPKYWRNHIRETVRFAQGMQTLHQRGATIFIEIGPKPTLLGLGRSYGPNDTTWLPSLRPKSSDWQTMLESLAKLYSCGLPIDWAAVAGDSNQAYQRLTLPTYPFQRQRHWVDIESTPLVSANGNSKNGHEQPRQRLALANDPAIRFAFNLGQELPAYLKHHRIFERAVLPAGVYFEIALTCAKDIFNTTHLCLENLIISQPLILPDDPADIRTTQVTLTPTEQEQMKFEFFSLPEYTKNGATWISHAVGSVRLADHLDFEEVDLATLRQRCPLEKSVEQYYQQASQQQISYRLTEAGNDTPDYQVLQQLWTNSQNDEALGRIHLPPTLFAEAEAFALHPLLIEGGIQVARATFPLLESNSNETYLPIEIDQFQLFRSVVGDIWAYAQFRGEPQVSDGLKVEVLLGDEDGLLAKLVGLSFKRTSSELLFRPIVQKTHPVKPAKQANLLEKLAQATPPQRQTLLKDYLQTQTRQILGLRKSQPLPRDSSLKDLGLDSLMSADMKNRLGRDLDVTIAMERLMQPNCNLNSLLDMLLDKMAPSPSAPETIDQSTEDSGDFHSASSEIPQIHAVVTAQEGRKLKVDDRWVFDFASCNYLGLDLHPGVMETIMPAVKKWGVHPSWTRAVASPEIYEDLEQALAKLMGSYSTLVFPAVTLLHAGVMPVLAGYDGVIFKDISAHRSIDEACRLAQTEGAEVVVFQHNDPVDLEQRLAQYPLERTKIIAIDGVYSMSGAYPPLPEFSRLAKQYNATVYMDDAHGMGVIGEKPTADMPYGFKGNGVVNHFGLNYKEDRLIYVAGLSKSYSSFGAFITCTDEATKNKFRSASTFIFSGPSPVASLASALAGLRLNELEGETWRAQVYKLTHKLVMGAKELGFEVVNDNYFPIVGVVIGPTKQVVEACQILWEYGILITPALFPIVPLNRGLLRWSITAANTEEEIDQSLAALKAVRERLLSDRQYA